MGCKQYSEYSWAGGGGSWLESMFPNPLIRQPPCSSHSLARVARQECKPRAA
jgi:hypothetical protein